MKKLEKYLNEISDERNPEFLFQTTHTDLLLQIANGRLDAVKQAKKVLSDRGLDKRGKWIGFKESEKLWGVK